MAIKLKVSETSAKLKATSTDALQFGVEQGIPIYPDPYEGSYEVTPTEAEQTLETDGLMMTDDVTVGAIPSDYVGSGIDRRDSTDLTASGNTVTAPAGYYGSSASKSVQSGSATTPTGGITANPSISVDSNGLITASVNKSESITPIINEGYVTNGTAGTITFSGSATQQMTKRTSSDLTQSGATVTAPAGYYPSSASKTIPDATMKGVVNPYPETVGGSVDDNGLVGINYEIDEYAYPIYQSGYATPSDGVLMYNSGTLEYQLPTAENVKGGLIRRDMDFDSWVVEDTGVVAFKGMGTAGWIEADNNGYVSLDQYGEIPNAQVDYDIQGSYQLSTQGATTITPTTSEQVAVAKGKFTTGAVIVNPIPSTYAKRYELVERIYSDSFNLSTGTSFNSWTASTTAGSILATATLSSSAFNADLENYEYLLWWKIWIKIAHTSGATLKAIPVWEGMDVVQSIFRRPNSLATMASGTKAGNACVTQTTAPYMEYYNSSGTLTYTFSNSYGLYGTVQTATFSNATSLTPTVTPKRPILYARCSNTYFATGRKSQIDSANSTFYLTCDLYRQPIDVYGQTKLYEGIASTYINSNS